MMETNRIIEGDVLEKIKEIQDGEVHCIVTSPPYYGLRDYGTANWEGGNPECDHKPREVNPKSMQPRGDDLQKYKTNCLQCGAQRIDTQIGLEETPQQYIEKMVQVFRECKRILHPSGTLWLNLGDSYVGSGTGHKDTGKSVYEGEIFDVAAINRTKVEGLKSKDLLMIPFRVAIALQADGWWLRSVIPWLKRGAMPESVTDRPSSAIEYVFMLAKSQKYFYDIEAVRVKNQPCSEKRAEYGWHGKKLLQGDNYNGITDTEKMGERFANPSGRNRRNSDSFFESWQGLYEEDNEPLALIVNPQGFPEAHFATFSEGLISPLIKAGTSQKGCCPTCGEPHERVVEKKGGTTGKSWHDHSNDMQDGNSRIDFGSLGSAGEKPYEVKTLGWKQVCDCEPKEPIPCIVFDPFMGSGTTALVALKLNRQFLGCELNEDYILIAQKRIKPYLFQSKLKTFI